MNKWKMQAVALVREDWSTNETATNKKVAQLEGKEQQKVLAEKARKIFFLLFFIYMQEPHFIYAVIPVAFTSINEEKDAHILSMQGPQISWCFSAKLRQATDFESQHKGQIDPRKDWTGSCFEKQITDADALAPD